MTRLEFVFNLLLTHCLVVSYCKDLSVEHVAILFVCYSLKTPLLPLPVEWPFHILLGPGSHFINFLTFTFSIYLFSSNPPHSISLCLWKMAQIISDEANPFIYVRDPIPSYLLRDLAPSVTLLYRAFPVPFSFRRFSNAQYVRYSRP